jgi:vacuolar protein sorting-associated protein 11
LFQIGDSADATPEFKVWNLNKLIKSVPSCLKQVKTNIQKPTALAVAENGQCMAIGFERGNVSIYKGDIARDKTKSVKNLTFGTSTIQGISIKTIGKVIQIFVCSDSGVYMYVIEGRDKESAKPAVFDQPPKNILTTCSWLQTGHNDGYFMVGRDDAIYCYTADGRAPCYAFDQRKVLIRWFRSHLLMVTTPIHDNFMQKTYTLKVIDVTNRFIVFTTEIDAISSVFVEFGTCYALTKDKTLLHLDEKDLQSKLNSLYKKNMYDTAVKIAKNNQYDAEGLSDIFKQYGDHLYGKANFAGAVEQYIKTIGYLEPSYVIRRFLDSRHTQYLTEYLQSIHTEGKATTDHTTLLLNCFTRLDRTSELKNFLENYKENRFDVDVAIRVCRKSCIDQALELAKFNNKHNHAVSILIEDMKKYYEAVEYISTLSYDDAEYNVTKFGTILMEKCPERFIELLKKMCTDYVVKKCDEPKMNNEIEYDNVLGYQNFGFEREKATPEDFVHLFTNSQQTTDYIEFLIVNLPTCSTATYNFLIEHYLTLWKNSTDKSSHEQRLIDIIKNSSEFYDSDHVLMICQTYEFWIGVMLIYEEKRLYNIIVRHHLQKKDFGSLFTLCKRLGATDSTIWLHALNGLKNIDQVPTSFLHEILQVIAAEKLQSPLQVLNNLTAIENSPNLATVRGYFMQVFQKEAEQITQYQSSAEKYRKESDSIKKSIQTTKNELIEFRGSLCDACHQPLILPALFFLCKHSFHQECIRSYSETEKDCMVCRKKNMQLQELLMKQNIGRNQSSDFEDKLKGSFEPFSIIADYFSKGLFNKSSKSNEEQDDDVDLKTNIPMKVSPAKPKLQNVAMSEGKMRLEENLRSNYDTRTQHYSEGRLRLQEQNYGTKSNVNQPTSATSTFQLPKKKVENAPKIIANYPISSNPFGDDDEDDEDDSKNPFSEKSTSAYDDTKNPFGDDAEDAEDVASLIKNSPKPRTIQKSTNPFGDEEDDD